MIIVMKPNYTPQQLEGVVAAIKSHGLTPHITYGVETAIVAAVGEFHIPALDPFEILDGVQTVKRISQPFKLGSRQVHPENSVFPIDGFQVGGNDIVVIAGPCAVESRSQILETAHAVREEGLEYLAEARAETGMPIVVEIMSQTQLDLMVKYVDVLQVGARNMQNFNLLRAIGETRKSVLLKRGLSATIEELLMSAEYILAGGNKQVMLCERGIRTFETSTRNTTDINAIPVLKNLTHLPVILDPSHATGHSDYVSAIARAAIAAGADGLIIEVHPDPTHAASDGKQSLKPEKFAEMVRQVKAIAEAMGRRIAPIKKTIIAGW